MNHVGVNLITRLNPAYLRVGFGVEVQPLAILTLRANVEHRGYFGTVGMLQSWKSPLAEYDDDTRATRSGEGASYIASGYQLTAQAIVRAKVGPIAFLNEFNLHHFRMDLREGDRVFYNAFSDTLAPGRGNLLVDNAHLFYMSKAGWIVGVRYTIVHAFYPDDWLAGVKNPNTPNHKLGPIAAYTFASSWGTLRHPTIILALNWWLKNRYRTGQRVTQALPYGIVAFTFSGDLWRQK